jgi:Tfp pilus assembly protein PilV
MTNTDGLRQQIAAALHSVGYRGTESAVTALLPVVTAWAKQQARQRAAEELRAAAEELRSDRDDATTGEDPGDPWTYNEAALTCTQRADALADEDPA